MAKRGVHKDSAADEQRKAAEQLAGMAVPLPHPPAWLPPSAVDVWEELRGLPSIELTIGIAGPNAVANYCAQTALYRAAIVQAIEQGPQSQMSCEARQQASVVNALATAIGLSPQSRKKLMGNIAQVAADDKFAEWENS